MVKKYPARFGAAALMLFIVWFSACNNDDASTVKTETLPQTAAKTVSVGGSYFCPSQTFAICNKALCAATSTTAQDGLVECSCDEIASGYTLSPLPCDTLGKLTSSTQLVSTYTSSNTEGSYAYKCTNTAYADCYGALCSKDVIGITCTCPYFTKELVDVVIITDTKTDDPEALCAANVRSATAASSWGSPLLQEAGKQVGVEVIAAPSISNP